MLVHRTAIRKASSHVTVLVTLTMAGVLPDSPGRCGACAVWPFAASPAFQVCLILSWMLRDLKSYKTCSHP